MDTSDLNINGKYEKHTPNHGDYSKFTVLATCKRKSAHVTTDNYKVCMVHLIFAFVYYFKCVMVEPSLQHVECARSSLI